jgi:hypothetical protein
LAAPNIELQGMDGDGKHIAASIAESQDGEELRSETASQG